MGYTTEFKGSFDFDRKIPENIAEYINRFSNTRHMLRDNDVIKELYPNWKENCWNGDLGTEGEYFLDEDYDYRENKSVKNHNYPPESQPGLWCQWVVTEDREHLEWDGAEKFYYYQEWLEYLIRNFFAPSGIRLNGEVKWQGEDMDDRGLLIVEDNAVSVRYLE